MNDQGTIFRNLEAVLFIADEAVPTADLAVLFELPSARIEVLLGELAESFESDGRGIVLRRVAGGWRMATHPDTAPYLERFVGERKAGRLSQAALETLAIIAYRQPIARGQISEIRGVSSDGVLRTLVARGVVEEVGRDPGPGQAILFGTTAAFLEKLGSGLLGRAALARRPDAGRRRGRTNGVRAGPGFVSDRTRRPAAGTPNRPRPARTPGELTRRASGGGAAPEGAVGGRGSPPAAPPRSSCGREGSWSTTNRYGWECASTPRRTGSLWTGSGSTSTAARYI